MWTGPSGHGPLVSLPLCPGSCWGDRNPFPCWVRRPLHTEHCSRTDPQASVSESTRVLACPVVTSHWLWGLAHGRSWGGPQGQPPAHRERDFMRDVAEGGDRKAEESSAGLYFLLLWEGCSPDCPQGRRLLPSLPADPGAVVSAVSTDKVLPGLRPQAAAAAPVTITGCPARRETGYRAGEP